MELYRITQEQFADDLSGNGSRLFGGRWNSEGIFAVYSSSFRSLSLLETLAHTPAKLLGSKNYQLITLQIPDTVKTEEILLKDLPIGWDSPDATTFTQKLGDRFFQDNKKLLLSIPSVLMQEEINYVLNPLHTDMKKVKIINKRRVYFDKRISETP